MRKGFLNGLCVLGICIAMAIFLRDVVISEQGHLMHMTEYVDTGWYYMDHGERIDVKLPATLPADEEELVIYHDDICSQYGGQVMEMYGALYDLQVRADGQQLFVYDDTGFPRNEQMKAKLPCNVWISEDLKDATLEVVLHRGSKDVYNLQNVQIGTAEEIFWEEFWQDAATWMLAIAMLAVSVVSLGTAIYMKIKKLWDSRFLAIALFLIFCSVWCITDSALGQVFAKMSPVLCYISFLTFTLMAVPMLFFIRATGDMKRYRVLDVCIGAFYVNVIGQMVLNYLKVYEMIEMLWITHVLMVIAVVLNIYLLYREYKRTGNKVELLVLRGFSVMGIIGIVSLVLYWTETITFYEKLFEAGILFFVVVILAGVLDEVVSNLKFKTEMQVYQRFAEEDRLTGMKNRKAYEVFLERLEQSEDVIKDAVLIYMDVNKLKEINDLYGHNAGDELVIAAARCIENTFGEYGNCYRIEGDEFCVVVLNPEKTMEEWMEQLEQEILEYNRRNRWDLSIARGYSYLRDEDGARKSVSDWKYEADKSMYENKGWKRIRENDI